MTNENMVFHKEYEKYTEDEGRGRLTKEINVRYLFVKQLVTVVIKKCKNIVTLTKDPNLTGVNINW